MIDIETVVGTGMKLTCFARTSSLGSCRVVSRAVSTRATVQVLSGILLRAEGGRLELAATDMELSLRASLEAEVEGERRGRRSRPPARRPRAAAARGRRDARAAGGGGGARGHVRLGELPPAHVQRRGLPAAARRRERADFTVDRAAFLETVARVARAASRDESRPVLTGILVRFEGGKLVMAATDSYRLAVKETELETEGAPELEAIVPARALAELARIAADADELRARRAGEPRRLQRRRRLADDAPHRRAVPELQAAAPRDVRARGGAAARGVARGRPAHVASWRSATRRSGCASPRAS